MKKLLLALLITTSISSYSQITFEHTYAEGSNNGPLKIIQLANSGYKYYLLHSSNAVGKNDTIFLYDLTHALYKTIPVPVTVGNMVVSPDYISETLFNNDNLIEFAYSYYVQGSSNKTTANVINENGSVLFTKYLGAGYGGYSLQNAGTQFKFFVTDSAGNVSVYSLPGTIPCNLCGGYAGISQQGGGANERMSGLTSQPMPNPSDGNAVIKYNLPNGVNKGEVVIYNTQGTQVKTYTVDRSFDNLLLSNTDLAAGTYFYQLKTANGFSDTKKMFIIK